MSMAMCVGAPRVVRTMPAQQWARWKERKYMKLLDNTGERCAYFNINQTLALAEDRKLTETHRFGGARLMAAAGSWWPF